MLVYLNQGIGLVRVRDHKKYWLISIGIGIGNTFPLGYWYWYWQYFLKQVLVLVLPILWRSIVNNPATHCVFLLMLVSCQRWLVLPNAITLTYSFEQTKDVDQVCNQVGDLLKTWVTWINQAKPARSSRSSRLPGQGTGLRLFSARNQVRLMEFGHIHPESYTNTVLFENFWHNSGLATITILPLIQWKQMHKTNSCIGNSVTPQKFCFVCHSASRWRCDV